MTGSLLPATVAGVSSAPPAAGVDDVATKVGRYLTGVGNAARPFEGLAVAVACGRLAIIIPVPRSGSTTTAAAPATQRGFLKAVHDDRTFDAAPAEPAAPSEIAAMTAPASSLRRCVR